MSFLEPRADPTAFLQPADRLLDDASPLGGLLVEDGSAVAPTVSGGTACPYRRTIDAPQIPVDLACGVEPDMQGFEDAIVRTYCPPCGELIVHGLPWTEPLGQVPPG
ncbi:MAG: hypothetical protein WD060_14205 [Pirellulales bacterium]